MKTFSETFDKNLMPGTSANSENDSSRKPTKRELRKWMKDEKIRKQGGAGIPCTWMWKELSEMTIAEATAMVEAMRSGRTWGEIMMDGVGGPTGEVRDHEYKQAYQY